MTPIIYFRQDAMKIKTNHFNKDSILEILISNNKTKTNNTYLKALTLSVLLTLQACNPAQDFTNYKVEVQNHLAQGTPQTAIILLKNVLRKNPDDSAARFTLGNIYLEAGNLLLAQKEITRAYKLSPNSSAIKVSLAKVFLNLTEFKKITPLFSNLEGWPSDLLVAAYAIQSQVNIYHGNLDQAYKTLANASQINAKHPDVLYSLALLESQQLSFSKATKHLEQLLSNNPNDFKGLLLQGNIALKNQNFDEAVKLFKKASKIFRIDNIAKIKMAEALVNGNKLDEAKKQLLTLLKASPSNGRINYLLATVEFTQKNYEKAAKFAEKTINNAERQPQILYIASASNHMIKNDETAYSQVRKLLTIVPEHPTSLKLKAAIELKLGLTTEATLTLNQINGESFNPSDSEILVAAGLASLKADQVTLSKQLIQQASTLKSNNPKIEQILTTIAIKEGDIETAIAKLNKTIKDIPESQGTQIILIMSYIENRQLDLAIQQAKKYSDSFPKSPHGITLTGLSHVLNNDIQQAKEAFDHALSISPGDPNASQNLAKLIVFQTKDYSRTKQLHMDVIEYHPNNIASLIELFFIEQENDIPKSILWLEQAARNNPTDLLSHTLLSQVYIRTNNPVKALNLCYKILPLHPNDFNLLALIGDAQRLSGQNSQSIESFEKLIKLAPDKFYPYYRLAALYQDTGQLTLANNVINKAIKFQPKHLGALLLKGRIALKSGKKEIAKTTLKQLQEIIPNNILVTELQAKIASASGDSAKAVQLYTKILAEKENNFFTLQLASAQWQDSKQQAALATLSEWIKRYPEDILALNALGNFYLLGNQFNSAISIYEKVIEKTPNNRFALNNLAWLLLQQNDLSSALEHAKNANSFTPSHPDILDTYGMILFSQEDFKAAKKQFESAIDIRPTDLNIQFHLAQANYKIGKLKKSKNMLISILAVNDSKFPFSYNEDAKQLLKVIEAN